MEKKLKKIDVRTFEKRAGQRVTVDDIDGWQEFVMDFLDPLPGVSGEEFKVKTGFKIRVSIFSSR